MLEFRVVGKIKRSDGSITEEKDSWGRGNLSIATMKKLANAYNIKYVDWYLEYREGGNK